MRPTSLITALSLGVSIATAQTITTDQADSWYLLGAVENISDLTVFTPECATTLWTYDGSWSKYEPGGSSNALSAIQQSKGFWLKSRQACTITLETTESDNGTDDFTYSTITSSVTGKVWMDRNLGASRVCQSYSDEECYGDYYQWGRVADGHEKSSSNIISTQATSITPGHGSFITGTDWTSSDSDGSLRQSDWNPCPTGFRIPTSDELTEESISDLDEAFSQLQLPAAGSRSRLGSLGGQQDYGYVWSSTPKESIYAFGMSFGNSTASVYYDYRTSGFSIRCIKE